jgi:hypothetical protein
MEAKRTLVKSPPELWAELSDPGALARHLGEFGEIRITRAQPESVVEWEGDRASGCVRLDPAGWGTRVTLTAEPVAAAAPVAAAEPARGLWARLLRRRPAREPAPPPPDPQDGVATLTGVLDTLGAAHHRPFSRP